MSVSKSRSILGGAVVLALLASPALAVDVIQKGADVWTTVQGFTQTSFAWDPIPAGFFCEGSKPFDGKILFKGEPLATKPAHSLGTADTAVKRLDDAVFNDKGEASTRIQLMALSLASLEPIETSCGRYEVKVRLTGEQPTTTMKIVRTEKGGGRYEAPLALQVKMIFSPVDSKADGRRELTRRINLGPGTNTFWTYSDTPRYEGPVWIDTDGDDRPDTEVKGSNFVAGMSPGTILPAAITAPLSCPTGTCPKQACHCNPDSTDPNESSSGCSPDHRHCIVVCVTSPPPCFQSTGTTF